ncbi:serine hydrolase domain-containing protein [Microcoleus sp. FACHB-68]|uniref:serine hydrolase domain-containing protein n=1 Tax=Microcoleus sp. FACHB-68 TaxID=2692826 RepID=UPI0016837641|nr:serine hydrolase domain-containing protein [Microcoleus sp. FACHB-68]MBD1938387.1 beta-lactamase family protein [Microcoleus sp. FACHB-68]
MSKRISRRRFLKHSQAGILGLSTFGLVSLGCNSRASGQLKTNVPAEKLITDLQQQIPQLMQRSGVPGVAVAVVRDREILWSRGFGVKNTDSGQPVNENTVFAAASLSKPVLAYAAMKLYERGELDLDAPLTNYTAKPYISDPRIWKISARLVLSHTTGFPNWSGDEPVWIDFTPGSKFSYSSEGFLYLQSVIERITRQPFNEYVTRNVFAPLGMTNSSYIWRSSFQSLAANGHDRDGVPFPVGKPSQANGAGSLRTTATDYAKFLIAMMEPAVNDPFRLNEQSLEIMLQQNSRISQSLGWGLGWGLERTNDGDFFWHWGDSGIFKSFTLGSKRSKTGMVILTNSENGLRICENIVRLAIGGQHPAFSFSMIDY